MSNGCAYFPKLLADELIRVGFVGRLVLGWLTYFSGAVRIRSIADDDPFVRSVLLIL